MSKRKPEWLDDEASSDAESASSQSAASANTDAPLVVKCPVCGAVFHDDALILVEEDTVEFTDSTPSKDSGAPSS